MLQHCSRRQVLRAVGIAVAQSMLGCSVNTSLSDDSPHNLPCDLLSSVLLQEASVVCDTLLCVLWKVRAAIPHRPVCCCDIAGPLETLGSDQIKGLPLTRCLCAIRAHKGCTLLQARTGLGVPVSPNDSSMNQGADCGLRLRAPCMYVGLRAELQPLTSRLCSNAPAGEGPVHSSARGVDCRTDPPNPQGIRRSQVPCCNCPWPRNLVYTAWQSQPSAPALAAVVAVSAPASCCDIHVFSKHRSVSGTAAEQLQQPSSPCIAAISMAAPACHTAVLLAVSSQKSQRATQLD